MEDGLDVWQSAVQGTEELQTMLIIDEAHVEHNSRDHKKTSAEQILFNTMARKLRIHVIYITQDILNVDNQFRRMCQTIYYCRNAKHATFFGLIHFPFNLFFRVPYLCGPGVAPKVQKPEVILRPISWGMFNSHALVGRAAETFSILKSAKTSPLKRLKRPLKPLKWHLWIPIAVVLMDMLNA